MDASSLVIIPGEQEVIGALDELEISLKICQGHSENVCTSNFMSLNLH